MFLAMGKKDMISRDWHCLNPNCGNSFHSYDKGNPECPKCGCVRVSWIPGGGHIGKTGPTDQVVQSLATDYGMSDINSVSHSRNNRAMPKYDGAVADPSLGVKAWAPGFSSHWSSRGATCTPSLSPPKPDGGKATYHRAGFAGQHVPSPTTRTNIEGVHVPSYNKE